MTEGQLTAMLWTGLVILVHLGFMARAIVRPHREPASRIAWAIVIIVVPLVGILAYVLLGETNIGRRRVARMLAVQSRIPRVENGPGWDGPDIRPSVPERHAHLFGVGRNINGYEPVGGNRARLMLDSNAGIEALVADIDRATSHVHLIFYIWLPDNNGIAVVEALERAAARGVTCRAMADGLGSRTMVASEHWRAMQEAGVRVGVALPLTNPLLRPLQGRIDLRNHRKIVIIDNHITYCGSQNCADPEFLIKAKFAPWVDILVRFEGPIARENQHLFAGDWLANVADGEDEEFEALLTQPLAACEPGITAQVIGTGPTIRPSAMPEVFATLMHAARRELFVTTPYYVPDEAMHAALCASARRGVDTNIIFPARNDSWIVGAASRSYYEELLTAGVHIHEYEAGLLHTKSLTLDGEVTLIGSANMDRRSFELNYENNILCFDPELTAQVRERQDSYLTQSHPVTTEMVAQWSLSTRLWNNTIGMLGPVL